MQKKQPSLLFLDPTILVDVAQGPLAISLKEGKERQEWGGTATVESHNGVAWFSWCRIDSIGQNRKCEDVRP